MVDGNEIATGATTERIEVAARGTAVAAVPVSADGRQALANGGLESVGSFALGLAARNRQPTRVRVAIRSSVKFMEATIKSPNYIIADKDVTARQFLNDPAPLVAIR